MQQRIKQTALGLALIVSTSLSYAADPTFFNNTAPTSKPSSSSGFPTPNVMSSSDFSSRVQNLNQETKSRLSQETTGLIPKPPTTAGTAASTTPQPVATPTSATTTTTSGQSGSNFTGFGTGTTPPPSSNSGSTSGSDSNSKLKPSAPAKSGGFQIQY